MRATSRNVDTTPWLIITYFKFGLKNFERKILNVLKSDQFLLKAKILSLCKGRVAGSSKMENPSQAHVSRLTAHYGSSGTRASVI